MGILKEESSTGSGTVGVGGSGSIGKNQSISNDTLKNVKYGQMKLN